jgi:hypothetical protein
MELRNTAAGLGYTVPTNNMYHVFEGEVNDNDSATGNTVAMIMAAATTGSTLGTGTAASNIHPGLIEAINQSIAPTCNQMVQNQSVLQNQIAAMLLSQPPPAQVVPPVQHVSFPMQQPFQPPMQQQQYQQAAWYGCGQQSQFQGGPGRQGGRGRGRGGSQNGHQHRPSFAAMICNQQGHGQLAPYQGCQGGMFASPNPFGGTGPFLQAAKATTSTNAPSPIKRFANLNACFSCGFDVADGHTLATCPFEWCKPNHQVGYARENAATYAAYGPSMIGQQKTQFPAL